MDEEGKFFDVPDWVARGAANRVMDLLRFVGKPSRQEIEKLIVGKYQQYMGLPRRRTELWPRSATRIEDDRTGGKDSRHIPYRKEIGLCETAAMDE